MGVFFFCVKYETATCNHLPGASVFLCVPFFFFFYSQRLNVFLVTQSVLTNREGKISFSDWPVPGIDFSNTIWPRRGGRKQSWASSSLRHVFLTLAGLLRGRGELYVCTHPTARVDIMRRRFAQNHRTLLASGTRQILPST